MSTKEKKLFEKSKKDKYALKVEKPKKKRYPYNPMYYYLNKLMSFDPQKYWFYICIGSRGRGKTVSAWRWVLRRFVQHGEMFIWLRLTDAPIKKMSRNNSTTIVPQFILDQVGIDSIFIKGNTVYANFVEDEVTTTKMVGIMDSIYTFYTTKGNNMEAFTNVVFDEINREISERNTFDVVRAFINQIESIARLRQMRVLMLGNTISDTSDILSIFNFQPKEFGIYKLTRRRTIIEYLEDSEEFKKARKESLAGVLLGDNDEVSQSFVNKAVNLQNRIEKYNRHRQLFIFFVDTTRSYGVYERQASSSGLGGLYVGEVRGTSYQKYKISPFLNCEGIYDMDIYKNFLELVGSNNIWFETTMIRQRFIVALKKNRMII